MVSKGTTFLLFIIILYTVSGDDACRKQFYLDSLKQIKARDLSSNDCLQLSFETNEKLNSHLGSLNVGIVKEKDFLLNISFYDIKWKKAYLKLSEINNMKASSCKLYTVGSQVATSIPEAFDQCFTILSNNSSIVYQMEFKAQLNTDVLYRKIIFKQPLFDDFDNSVPIQNRAIFCSVDASSNYGIILKIQALPFLYNVTYYKVEVFREKDNTDILLDVRMLEAGKNREVSFEYITYNEEGYYFFKVSAISAVCPEESCIKSTSPKIYIRRKYPPLVIGIVGASFLIPFILFIFHMWNRRNQLQDENEQQKDKVFVVFNQTPEKHYTIVKTLERCLKNLSNVQIVTRISEATHILYICGVHIFDPDPAAHKFLVIEANKAISNIEIFVISFPYSTKEIPPYLKKCLKFDLMDDFGKLIRVFNCDAEYANNALYIELNNKVKAAQIQTEPKKITLNMPIIIVTEQSDSSDTEPKEADVLL